MNSKEHLLNRLDAIGRSLAANDDALALLGLGSVGQELDRLDAYSDLDFFVIVDDGAKPDYLADLNWLGRVAPLAYAFRNTEDGYKVLYADAVFCEFAIFTLAELERASYAPGRLVWARAGFDLSLAAPRRPLPPRSAPSADHLLGEALTNLYVGLARFHRGEKLSAMRFIQGYAVDRLLELSHLIAAESGATADRFDGPRRYEQRFPALAADLPSMLQGYERSPESALALLAVLDEHFTVDPAIKAAIIRMATDGGR